MTSTLLAINTALIYCAIASSAYGADKLSIFGHPAFPVDKIEKKIIKKIYIGAISKKWSITILPHDLPSSHKRRKQFMRNILKFKSPMKYNEIWVSNYYKGKTDAPKVKKNIDLLIKTVATTPGAIGYAMTSEIKRSGEKVKILYSITLPEKEY